MGRRMFPIIFSPNLVLTLGQAYLTVAAAMRYAIPCGLNVCPPFHTIAETLRPASLLPPASSVIEDECRRNTFWIG